MFTERCRDVAAVSRIVNKYTKHYYAISKYYVFIFFINNKQATLNTVLYLF